MRVTVTTNLPMYLARVLTSSTILPVAATAYAEIEQNIVSQSSSTALLVQ
jgi:hypothetical protein